MDLGKLGVLIKKCREANVDALEIDGDKVSVSFFGEVFEPETEDEPQFLNFNHKPDVDDEKVPSPFGEDIDDEIREDMEHLLDPVAWQNKALKQASVAVGSDEEESDV